MKLLVMYRVILIIVWIGVLAIFGYGAHGEEKDARRDSEQKLQAISRSVYRVFAMDSRTESLATGSGFFIEKKGFLLTNFHVVNGRDSFAIFIVNEAGNDATMKEATLMAYDRKNDLALLRVKGDDLPAPFKLSSKEPRLLQKVIAVGFPGGADVIKQNLRERNLINRLVGGIENLIPNVTLGSISKITDEAIVHDCKIGHGSSGGPLIDARTGEVVGVNYAGQTDSAYVTFFFAIPAQKVRDFLAGKTGQVCAEPSGRERPRAQTPVRSAPSQASQISNDDLVSLIVQEHIKGGMEYPTIRREMYENIIYYKGTGERAMSLAEYEKDCMIYRRRWPQRVYEILSVSQQGKNISVILKFRCRSSRGRVVEGFSHILLVLSNNLRIQAIAEAVSARPPADFPRFASVRYRGKRVFTSK